MLSSTAVPMFMFGTLGVVLLIGIVLILRFYRKRENRHPMAGQRERNTDEIRRGVPPGE